MVFCQKETISFQANSDDPTANYFWNFGDPNSSDNTANTQNASHQFTQTGTYTVRLTSTNICLSDTTTLELNIRENPIPNFDFSIDTCSSELTLTNTSIDIADNNYEWYVNNININQSVFNYAIENNTNYEIKLLANKNTECADSLSTTINYIVDDSNQYLSIPDAFSPNGDNQNDVFVIRTSSKCLLEELEIYDRFGSIIYKQNDEDKFYWDGKINNTTQADGVYIVHLKYNGKQYIRTLSLIK
jgi:gliding motility-associated-like protein